jgi:hypothetical protein
LWYLHLGFLARRNHHLTGNPLTGAGLSHSQIALGAPQENACSPRAKMQKRAGAGLAANIPGLFPVADGRGLPPLFLTFPRSKDVTPPDNLSYLLLKVAFAQGLAQLFGKLSIARTSLRGVQSIPG